MKVHVIKLEGSLSSTFQEVNLERHESSNLLSSVKESSIQCNRSLARSIDAKIGVFYIAFPAKTKFLATYFPTISNSIFTVV
jgi:hypothetical protein